MCLVASFWEWQSSFCLSVGAGTTAQADPSLRWLLSPATVLLLLLLLLRVPETCWCHSGTDLLRQLYVLLLSLEHCSDHYLLFVVVVRCFMYQQRASVSQGQTCSDNCTCCHTEIEAADPAFSLTQSQHADSGPTSPSADPTTPGARQRSRWSTNF